MHRDFDSVLWLDDLRQPLDPRIAWVKSYRTFVQYLAMNPMPELICFDHDLALEHYPITQGYPEPGIPYERFKEKTGLECARHVIENSLPLKYWSIHTQNEAGRQNLEAELRRYCPEGELRGLKIPFRVIDLEDEWLKHS